MQPSLIDGKVSVKVIATIDLAILSQSLYQDATHS